VQLLKTFFVFCFVLVFVRRNVRPRPSVQAVGSAGQAGRLTTIRQLKKLQSLQFHGIPHRNILFTVLPLVHFLLELLLLVTLLGSLFSKISRVQHSSSSSESSTSTWEPPISARCCCHCTARSMSNPSSAYIETLRSFLCFDGVIGSTERWWSGKKGFDFLDSGQAADGQVKYLDSVSSAVYVNHDMLCILCLATGRRCGKVCGRTCKSTPGGVVAARLL
jgi:hypothetical protein